MTACSEHTAAAWAKLVRVEQGLLANVEADLKAAGFPPLAWYDALLELARAPCGKLRPSELERAVLLPQYSTSRLVDRLVKANYAARRLCPVDGRGQFIEITAQGRKLQKTMWPAYAAAIERHVGSKLTGVEVRTLRRLLEKLV